MLNKLKQFVGDVVLIDVFLKTQNAASNVLPRSIDPSKISLNFDFNASFEKLESDKLFISYQSLQVKAVKIKDHKESVEFDLIVEFALVYNYQNFVGDVTEDIMLEFSKSTALFNAYPYLRESIHSLSCKMGLPPIVAPLLKVEPPKVQANKDSTIKKIPKKVLKKKVKT